MRTSAVRAAVSPGRSLSFPPSATTVAVCGATGNQGFSVLKALSQLGYHTRALTRDPISERTVSKLKGLANVTPLAFHLGDKASAERAFEGADVVYGMTSSAYDGDQNIEAEQGKLLVDVAKAKNVKLFIWSGGHDIGPPKFLSIPAFATKGKIEAHVRASGIAHVVHHMGSFMENITEAGQLHPSDDPAELQFSLPHAHPTAALSPQIWIQEDLGRLVAASPQYPEQFLAHSKPVCVAERYYSASEIVDSLSRASGKKVTLDDSPMEAESDMDNMYKMLGNGDPAASWFGPGALEASAAFLQSVGFKFHSLDDFAREEVTPLYASSE